MPVLCRRNAAGRRQSESRVRENCKHGLTRGRWGDHFKPEAYSTRGHTWLVEVNRIPVGCFPTGIFCSLFMEADLLRLQ